MQTRFQVSEKLVWTEPFFFNSTGNSNINIRDKSKKVTVKVSPRIHATLKVHLKKAKKLFLEFLWKTCYILRCFTLNIKMIIYFAIRSSFQRRTSVSETFYSVEFTNILLRNI